MVIEPRGLELINRYKKNYSINVDAKITEDMILNHWKLEKSLRKELLKSNPDNRWDVFERCYSTLHADLWWLNQYSDTFNPIPPHQSYKNWIYLIRQLPQKIYEVGSGKGDMIFYFASCGFECKATEITRERGKKYALEHPNLSWSISDGIHLKRFEALNSYNVVISNQLIEHIHPDDLQEHFRGVFSILSREERYIFSTPHKYMCSSDVSRVF